jgi:hypothetical protein
MEANAGFRGGLGRAVQRRRRMRGEVYMTPDYRKRIGAPK